MTQPEPMEPDQSVFIPRVFYRPWGAVAAAPSPFDIDQVLNLQRREGELRQNDASEFSYGPLNEPPYVTQRANAQRRYATPAEGGAYHGRSPIAMRHSGCGPHHG
jgi:hypothetical protein